MTADHRALWVRRNLGSAKPRQPGSSNSPTVSIVDSSVKGRAGKPA